MMMDVMLTTYQGAILGPIARLLGYILQALYAALSVVGIQNVGICIILFTFIVNAIMLPMQIKQQKFAKLSAVMNPELMAIQNKYKNKKDQASQQKMSLETQAVYQKYGVSPASGCLPLLITFPILFALYRVIYNIPAYVPQVYYIYQNLAETLQKAGVSVDVLAGKDYIKTATYVVTEAVKNAQTDAKNINYYIDVLAQFNSSGWDALAAKYPDFATIINTTGNKAMHINSFLGLNIADTPAIKSVSVIIPILSIITQFISTKLSMASTPQNNASAEENPTMQSMKMMNNFMPFITGAMCLMFPIGVGIYWIAGNVFRIIQCLFLNLYFDHIDMDEEIKKNTEKAKKKLERLGQDTSVLERAAKMKTANLDPNTNKTKSNNASKSKQSVSASASKKKIAPVQKAKNTKYKEGSIAAYANMMKREEDK